MSAVCLVWGILLGCSGGGKTLAGVQERDETVNWQNHVNAEMSLGFKYPQTWKVEDGFGMDRCCLDLFSSVDPYEGDFLKQDVMKAQFQYHVNALVSSRQQYIDDSLVKSSNDDPMQTSVDRSSVVSLSKKGLDILKFSGGPSGTGYVIPIKENFSEVLYVIVWNPDESVFEKVLSTFYFIKYTTIP